MNTRQLDTIILGQGLAGTALAWWNHWSGAKVLVIDRAAAVTSSKVAAGLMTPITGQRLVPTWRWSDFWPVAAEFYRRVEQVTESSFFHTGPMVRCFTSTDDVRYFERRLASGEFVESSETMCATGNASALGPKSNGDQVQDKTLAEPVAHRRDEYTRGNVVRRPPAPDIDPQRLSAPHGSFEMLAGGRLDVTRYLDASRRFFEQHDAFLEAEVQLPGDVVLTPHGVKLPRWNLQADRLICCQGYDSVGNPWFANVEFQPAKGEILTVRIPGWAERRVIHGDVWLAPLGDDVVRVGATYDWSQIDTMPTDNGRRELEVRLQTMIHGTYEVLDHVAAVRPILRDPRPVLGLHPQWRQLGFLNGLASKGALMAPYFGRHLTRVIAMAERMDPSVDLARRAKVNG